MQSNAKINICCDLGLDSFHQSQLTLALAKKSSFSLQTGIINVLIIASIQEVDLCLETMLVSRKYLKAVRDISNLSRLLFE